MKFNALTAPGLLVLLSTGFGVNSCKSGVDKEKPNIIIILADDMGYGDVEILNPESRVKTPNINRIANEGLNFTDAHSAGSYCVPSRYGLLTGRYMWRTRLGPSGNLANYAGTLIEPGRITIAEMLRNQGYFTGIVGKWHQGIDWALFDESERDDIRINPNYQNIRNIDFNSSFVRGVNDYGFDYSFIKAGSAEMNPCAYIENDRVTAIPVYTTDEIKSLRGEWYGRDDNHIAEGFTLEGLVPAFSKKACDFIETAVRDNSDKPFFLYYAMTAPHNPIIPNKEFTGTSNAGAYGDFISEVDFHVGKILDKLKELKIEKNTLLIFTSDNGPINITKNPERWIKGDRNLYGHISNSPFSGWKGSIFEGGHRMPFFVRWPAKIKPGEVCTTTINFTDILPTFAEMLNIDLDENTAEDGVSFYKALQGKERPVSFHEAMIHNANVSNSARYGAYAVRMANFKLMVKEESGDSSLISNQSAKPQYSLYDLDRDPKETNDISGLFPEKAKFMHELLKTYISEGRSK